jgi:hypothetical protein
LIFRGFLAACFAGAPALVAAGLEGAGVGAGVTVCATNNENGALNVKKPADKNTLGDGIHWNYQVLSPYKAYF